MLRNSTKFQGLGRAAMAGLLAAATLASCTAEVPPAQVGLNLAVRSPLGEDNPFQDIRSQFAALIAEGRDLGAAFELVEALKKSGTDLAIEVPFGVERQVRIEIWARNDATGQVGQPLLASGRTIPVTVTEGATPVTVHPYITFVNRFAPPVDDGGVIAGSDFRIGAQLNEANARYAIISGGANLKDGAINPYDPASYSSFQPGLLVYDADERKLLPTGAMMAQARAFHGSSSGREGLIVFAGGYVMGEGGPTPTTAVEFFDLSDPGTVKVASPLSPTGATQSPALAFARANCTVTRMLDTADYFLIAGGAGEELASKSWEVWSPQSGTVAQGFLSEPRWNHTAVRLPSGDGGYIVLAGGENAEGPLANFEVIRFDTAGNVSRDDHPDPAWRPIKQDFKSGVARTMAGAVFASRPPNYHFIYIVGGFEDSAKTKASNRIDIFDVQRGAWVTSTFLPNAADPNGGAWDSNAPAEFFLGEARGAPMVAAVTKGLRAGQVLVAGGTKGDTYTALATAEVIDFGEAGTFFQDALTTGAPKLFSLTPLVAENTMPEGGRTLGTAMSLSTGHVLVVGGAGQDGNGKLVARTSTTLWNPLVRP